MRTSENSLNANFAESPERELRRIPIPRTPVNKGKRRAGATMPGPSNSACTGTLARSDQISGLHRETQVPATQNCPSGQSRVPSQGPCGAPAQKPSPVSASAEHASQLETVPVGAPGGTQSARVVQGTAQVPLLSGTLPTGHGSLHMRG
jgi:hypothetical protein